MSDFADWFARQVDDEILGRSRRGPAGQRVHVATPEDFYNAMGATPFHPNCRSSAQPNVPEYKWIAFDAAQWMASRAEGPLGRVSEYEVYYDHEDRHVVIAWPCPVCGAKTTYGISDSILWYAGMEPMARERIRLDVFARLNGNSDNRCARCTRNSGVEGGPK